MKKVGVKMWKALVGLIELLIRRVQYKSRVEEKIDAIIKKQIDTERRVLRLEIIAAMKRNDRAVVHSLYDIYKNEYSGNSYMDELYTSYCKKTTKKKSKK